MSNTSYYVIKVREKLDDNWEEWFEGMTLDHDDEGTSLRGFIADQAALHGMIARVYRLGLQLVAVNEEEPPTTANSVAPAIHHNGTE